MPYKGISTMRSFSQRYTLLAKMSMVIAAIASLTFLVAEARETTETNQKVAEEGIGSLNEAELNKFMTRRIVLWSGFENAYFEHKRGVLGDTDWSRFYIQICKHFILEPDAWEGITHRKGIARSLTPEFRLYAEISCR